MCHLIDLICDTFVYEYYDHMIVNNAFHDRMFGYWMFTIQLLQSRYMLPC